MTDSLQSSLRPLGAFEHLIDLYIGRHPVQFSIAIELAVRVDPDAMARALATLQKIHPLLAARIDRAGGPSVFRHAFVAVPLKVEDTRDWIGAVAAEQTTVIDPDGAPLARASIVHPGGADESTVVILTFSHQIADGRGALRAIHDLLAVLDGRDVCTRPTPASQESLLESTPAPPETEPRPARETQIPRRPTASVRPFDGAAPTVEVAALDRNQTTRLRDTARTNDATVQGALCAAAAQALTTRSTPRTVRINSPIDLRSAVGLTDDVANRFTATTVELKDPQDQDFWALAQDATTQLRTGRTLARAAALALASLRPADAREAEAALLAATSADIEITNLGIVESLSCNAEAVWGPSMVTQVQGERVMGVVTYAGALRITVTGHDGVRGLATDMTTRLTHIAPLHSSPPRSGTSPVTEGRS